MPFMNYHVPLVPSPLQAAQRTQTPPAPFPPSSPSPQVQAAATQASAAEDACIVRLANMVTRDELLDEDDYRDILEVQGVGR